MKSSNGMQLEAAIDVQMRIHVVIIIFVRNIRKVHQKKVHVQRIRLIVLPLLLVVNILLARNPLNFRRSKDARLLNANTVVIVSPPKFMSGIKVIY